MDYLWLKVENIVAKGEIARFVQFLLLSLCFQIAVCCRGVRKRLYEGKGLGSSKLKTIAKTWQIYDLFLFHKENLLIIFLPLLNIIKHIGGKVEMPQIKYQRFSPLSHNVFNSINIMHHILTFLARLLKKRELLSWPWRRRRRRSVKGFWWRRRGRPVKVFCSA